ncbi:hypothetical protein [Streptomyces lavendulae]|uniref:hypothetical protein n=1 Tax=Streptomyces lavendulae TaxID=1914 RepID=UPI0031ECA763
MAIVALAVTAVATIAAAIIAGLANRSVAKATTRANIESETTRIKLSAVKEFLDAVDAYWQFANDLFDKRRPWTGWRRWVPKVGRKARPPSFRQETSAVTSALTRAQINLEAVTGDSVKQSVDDYVRELRDTVIAAYRGKWKPVEREWKNALIAAIRSELGFPTRERK